MSKMIRFTSAALICQIHALRSHYLLNQGMSFWAHWIFNHQKKMHFLRMIALPSPSLQTRWPLRYKTRSLMNGRKGNFSKPKLHQNKWHVRYGVVTRRGSRAEAIAMT